MKSRRALQVSGQRLSKIAGYFRDFNRVTKRRERGLETYRFDEAANQIYDFFWGEFCDWYIELIKPRLAWTEPTRQSSRHCMRELGCVLFEASLRLLHPVMPFITEEIWHAIYDGKPPLKSIALAAYPQADEKQFDLAAETEMAILQDLIVSVRNLRAELKVEQKQKVPIQVFTQDAEIRQLIEQNQGAIERLANVEKHRHLSRTRWQSCLALVTRLVSMCTLSTKRRSTLLRSANA